MWHRVVLTELYGIVLFVIGGTGSRLIGLAGLLNRKVRNDNKRIRPYLCLAAVLSLAFPLLSIQSIKVFEIIQFVNYYLFFIALLCAIGIAGIFPVLKSRTAKSIFIGIFVALTIPSTLSKYPVYKDLFTSPNTVSTDYREATQVISQQGSYQDTLLEIPKLSGPINEETIDKWWKAESTPGTEYFANKRLYLANQFIDFPNTIEETNKRKEQVKQLLQSLNTHNLQPKDVNFIHTSHLKYILSPVDLSTIPFLEKKYSNKTYTVYAVK